MRGMLVVLAYVLIAHDAAGFAPAHVRHHMSGRMVSIARPEVRITFDMVCIYYEDGPLCRGRFRCRPLGHGGHASDCPHARGTVSLEVTRAGPPNPYDPTWQGAGDVHFADGSSCRLDGTVPFLFGIEIPGVFGRYHCSDVADAEIDGGSFGLRTRTVGAPFHRYD